MGGVDVTKKSDPDGGIRRTITRHSFEGGAVTAFAALLVAKFGASFGITEVWEQSAALAILVGLLGGLAKFWHENGITQILLDRLRGGTPPAAGAAILAGFLLSGCAIQLGTANPKEFSGAFGETIVACEIRGISIAMGDADICRNVEGGHVSKTFADMVLGTIRTAVAGVAGLFSGFGQAGTAMQAALAPVPEATAEPAVTSPGVTVPKVDVGTGTGTVTTGPNLDTDAARAPFQ